MAAAVANRQVLYFTFGNVQLANDLSSLHGLLQEHHVTVAGLWQLLCQYYARLDAMGKASQASGPGLHAFIRSKLNAYDADTESENSPAGQELGADSPWEGSPADVPLDQALSADSPKVSEGVTSPIDFSSDGEDVVAPSPEAAPVMDGATEQDTCKNDSKS